MLRVTAIALLLSPTSAMACAVCAGAANESNAFLYSTLFMTALPLMMIFGGVFWLRSAYMAPPRPS
jgi:hypothetical protein